MSEIRSFLVETAHRLFLDACDARTFADAEREGMQPDLWRRLEASGFSRATVSEARGGDGADLGDALALVREAGRCSLPAPLAETLIAELMLSAAGLPVRAGISTVGPVLQGDQLRLVQTSGGYQLSGILHRVPWARHAGTVVVIAKCDDGQWNTAAVEAGTVAGQDRNYAHEPRDTLQFNDVIPHWTGQPGQGWTPDDLQRHGALFRLAAMAGALDTVLEMSVRYANDRVQFGKPIGRFQAVQQQLAVLASQVAAASAAADTAINAAQYGHASFEIAAAKVRVGEAAGAAAAIAHQVHGAMGFTQEYALQRSTRRLWSWRDEFGSEGDWAVWIGQWIARCGGAGLWPFLTSPHKEMPVRPF